MNDSNIQFNTNVVFPALSEEKFEANKSIAAGQEVAYWTFRKNTDSEKTHQKTKQHYNTQ